LIFFPDLFINGVRGGLSIPEEELGKMVAKKNPIWSHLNPVFMTFLLNLGFPEDWAKFIDPRICVDLARGGQAIILMLQ
jgi:hypothetical protein